MAHQLPEQQTKPSKVASWTRGLDDGYTQAIEMVATVVLFLFAGIWLDGHFASAPVFTLALALIAVVGNAAKAYYGYRARIETESEGKPWARRI